MKILILGAGQVGSSAAYHLSREEANEVTVVDSDRTSCASCRIVSIFVPLSAMPPIPKC